jgi:flagellar biogenesis protein FliO
MNFDWIKDATPLTALIVSLIIIAALVRFLIYMWKKFEENKKEVNSTILALSNKQTEALQAHNQQLVDVIDKVNLSIQQMTLATQSSSEINKSVKESTEANTQAMRELKDFLTGTVVRVLQDKT